MYQFRPDGGFWDKKTPEKHSAFPVSFIYQILPGRYYMPGKKGGMTKGLSDFQLNIVWSHGAGNGLVHLV